MEESSSQDHLSSSLTDLMTSLMVIFILLLLVFVQRTGAKDPAIASKLLEELRRELKPQGFGDKEIDRYKNDPSKIVIVAPERLMSFQLGSSALSDKGKSFLQEKLPPIAMTLWRFRDDIDSIVVEGHSDQEEYKGRPPDESRNLNLELSQQRAMEVVKTALADLKTNASPEEQSWFLEKLSASGRGQQDCSAADAQDECRKVIFVIRVRAADAKAIQAKIQCRS
jgi:flagellar motor protein MotB